MKRIFLLAVFLALIIVFGGGYYLLKTLKVDVEISPDKTYWGAKEEIQYKISANFEPPLGEVKIFIKQGNKRLSLYEGKIRNLKEKLVIELKNAGFKEGKAKLIALLEIPLENKVYNLYV